MHHNLPLQSSFLFVEKVKANDHCISFYIIKRPNSRTHDFMKGIDNPKAVEKYFLGVYLLFFYLHLLRDTGNIIA